MRNCAPESLIDKALQRNVNIDVPTAPEVGLYLDECFFSSYNQKWKDSHEEVSMSAYEKEALWFLVLLPDLHFVSDKGLLPITRKLNWKF